jgi:hypothetical protein
LPFFKNNGQAQKMDPDKHGGSVGDLLKAAYPSTVHSKEENKRLEAAGTAGTKTQYSKKFNKRTAPGTNDAEQIYCFFPEHQIPSAGHLRAGPKFPFSALFSLIYPLITKSLNAHFTIPEEITR